MKDEEHNPDLITGRVTKFLKKMQKWQEREQIEWFVQVREILKVSLGIARDVPILRVKRAHTGSFVFP